MSVQRQILDPLSTLCKIATLSFYDNGSRLSIIDNTVEVQKPDGKQWIIRTYRGDNKEHISLLYNPILKAIQWYIFQLKKPDQQISTTHDNTQSTDTLMDISTTDVENEDKVDECVLKKNDNDKSTTSADLDHSQTHDEKLKAVKNIMRFAIYGLKKLKATYKDGNVILALQFLINNLKIATKDEPDIELFKEYNEMNIIEEDGILNYSKIKEIWDINTVKNISNQFTVCDKQKSDLRSLEYQLESLNSMLKATDTKFQKLVNDMNSTL